MRPNLSIPPGLLLALALGSSGCNVTATAANSSGIKLDKDTADSGAGSSSDQDKNTTKADDTTSDDGKSNDDGKSDDDGKSNDDGKSDDSSSDQDKQLPADGGSKMSESTIDGGTDADAASPDAGNSAEPDAGAVNLDSGAGEAPVALSGARGFLSVNSDYESSSISVVSLSGEVLSPSIISSASAPAGLSAALSSDLALPSSMMSGDELIVIDRTNGVLTWLDLASADVHAQLNVTTGFAANPHDYIPLTNDKAYVTRWEPNFDAGQQDYDAGDDILVINPSSASVIGRIDLSSAIEDEDEGAGFNVRPERGILVGGQVLVTAVGMDSDFIAMPDSRIIRINPETDEIEQVLVLNGLKNCISIVASPKPGELAVSCTGSWGQTPDGGYPEAGIVRLAIEDTQLVELNRFPAEELGNAQINALAFSSANSVAYTTLGTYNDDYSAQATPDTLRVLDLQTAEVTEPILSTVATPYSINTVACDNAAATCVVTDAETGGGTLHHFSINDDGGLENGKEIIVDASLGLPPRYVGTY